MTNPTVIAAYSVDGVLDLATDRLTRLEVTAETEHDVGPFIHLAHYSLTRQQALDLALQVQVCVGWLAPTDDAFNQEGDDDV
jgi:hypothetical protein